MKRFRNLPTAAMIIAVIALVFALGGTGFAAKKLLKLGAFADGTKNKTVGVGKLTYVSTQQSYDSTADPSGGYSLTALCPANTRAIGGGTKLISDTYSNGNYFFVNDYPSTTGFTSRFFAGAGGDPADVVQVTAVCAVSRAVTGAPPAP
jgi:hypothetical protein